MFLGGNVNRNQPSKGTKRSSASPAEEVSQVVMGIITFPITILSTAPDVTKNRIITTGP